MKLKNKALFWIAATLLFVFFIWLFKSILLPFVAGIIIAYLLNPLLVKLGTFNLSRGLATLLVLSSFFTVVIALALLLLPPLYREIVQLTNQAPDYIDILWSRLQPYMKAVEETVGQDGLNQSITDAVKGNVSGALGASSDLFAGILSGGRALVGFVTFIIVSPLVAFFMMIEWPSITAWIDDLLPRHSHTTAKKLLGRIDAKMAGFIRGQLLVSLSLGILYAVALSLVGLEFGFLIGLAAGALSVIPLFGSTVGLLISVSVAWFQSGDILFVLIVAAIFLTGQLLEANFITPKLIGQSVGLHPLWILFALMAGGALLGIVGMVIAVPVTAAAGVLLSFAIEQYKDSDYYE
jgi:predicted PurR-regulated permease PerM